MRHGGRSFHVGVESPAGRGVTWRAARALSLALALCAGSAAAQTPKLLFGYAAIACGHDDPFDDAAKTDYGDEVAGFTNANQVCVTGDMEALAQRLRRAAAHYTPVFYVEPVFFDVSGGARALHPEAETLWRMVRGAIARSGVEPGGMIFYLADEPVLRGMSLAAVDEAARMIRRDYPGARVLVIEAYLPNRLEIPAEADIWGFNAYAIRDPGADQGYVGLLDRAAALLAPHQSLAIIMDAQHTPVHRRAGLRGRDMAEVAQNYYALARSRRDVSLMLGYTWAGGIDGPHERGVRDLPKTVMRAHQGIGREIIAGGGR